MCIVDRGSVGLIIGGGGDQPMGVAIPSNSNTHHLDEEIVNIQTCKGILHILFIL